MIVTTDTNGYQRVFVGRSHALADAAGYVRLHVLVAAADGLDVRSGHVHHRNGDKSDNRAENLVIVNPAQHARAHAAGQPRDNRGRFARSA